MWRSELLSAVPSLENNAGRLAQLLTALVSPERAAKVESIAAQRLCGVEVAVEVRVRSFRRESGRAGGREGERQRVFFFFFFSLSASSSFRHCGVAERKASSLFQRTVKLAAVGPGPCSKPEGAQYVCVSHSTLFPTSRVLSLCVWLAVVASDRRFL